MPFRLSEIVSLSSFLKDLSLGLVELAFPETRTSINDHYRSVLQSNQQGSTSQWPHLLKVCVSLLRQLHTRDLRRGFCPTNHWVVHTLNLPLDKPTDLEMPRGHRYAPRPFQPIKDFTREDFGKSHSFSQIFLYCASPPLTQHLKLFVQNCRQHRPTVIKQASSINNDSTRNSICCAI